MDAWGGGGGGGACNQTKNEFQSMLHQQCLLSFKMP